MEYRFQHIPFECPVAESGEFCSDSCENSRNVTDCGCGHEASCGISQERQRRFGRNKTERMRFYFDADREFRSYLAAPEIVGENRYEVHCTSYRGILFVNDYNEKKINLAFEESIDNRFVCEACTREYEEAVHGNST